MTYDPPTDRLTRIDYPGGQVHLHLRRRRPPHSRTDQDGHVENYIYDAVGRLDPMTDRAGGTDHRPLRLRRRRPVEPEDAGQRRLHDLRLRRRRERDCTWSTQRAGRHGPVPLRLHLRRLRPPHLDDHARTAQFLYGYDPLGQLTSVDLPRRPRRHLRLRRGRQPRAGHRRRRRRPPTRPTT